MEHIQFKNEWEGSLQKYPGSQNRPALEHKGAAGGGIGPVGTLQLLQKILSSVMDLMQCITER